MVGIPATGVREGCADIEGVSLRYVSVGQGPPVVLVHGLAGNLNFWGRNLEPLGRSFSVYALDLPGHGGSGHAPEYTLPYAARLIFRFLDHLKVPMASLVGSSLGGLIALETAHTYPDRVERLVLVDSAGFGRSVPWSLRLLTVPGLGEALARPTALATHLSMRQTLYHPGRATVATLWSDAYPPWRARTLVSILRYGVDLWGLKPCALWDGRRGQLRQPTLIVWGAQDRVFPVKHAYRAQGLLPGSRLLVIPECGHLPQWERPEAFNQAVVEFLKGG